MSNKLDIVCEKSVYLSNILDIMTKQEFINLPATRKGLQLLAIEFGKTDNTFFNEVSRQLRTYIQLPPAVKRLTNFSFVEILEKYSQIQSLGYRTDLKIPF